MLADREAGREVYTNHLRACSLRNFFTDFIMLLLMFSWELTQALFCGIEEQEGK